MASGGVEVAEGLHSVRVFTAGEEGYPNYRIPTIVTSGKGTILAFAEGRFHKTDHGRNDIVLKRSTDHGKTWGALIPVHADKDLVMVNPSPVVLPNGRILLMYEVFPFGFHYRRGREQGISFDMLADGYDRKGSQRCVIRFSDDDGLTWSGPRYVEKITREPRDIISSGSPANGIVLQQGRHRGRILFPMFHCKVTDRERGQRIFLNSVLYSDDRGNSWKRSKYVPYTSTHGDECLISEAEDGSVYMNSRSSGANRLIARSTDGGVTWSSFSADPNLSVHRCNNGLLRYSFKSGQNPGILLFSHNAARGARKQGVIQASFDDGFSWEKRKEIVPGLFGYSQLTKLGNNQVGMIFEPFGTVKEPWHIDFVAMDIDYLLN